MNTDKAFAEKIAADYAPKKTSKVVALRKLDQKAKLTPTVFASWSWDVSVTQSHRGWLPVAKYRWICRREPWHPWRCHQLSDFQKVLGSAEAKIRK